MRITKVLVAFVCVAGMLPAAWSQQDNSVKSGSHGPLSRMADAFNTNLPRAVADDSSANAGVTPTTGKIVVNFAIKLITPVTTGGTLVCSVSSSAVEISSTTGQLTAEIFEEASAKATVSGATATCSVNIPYSWNLLTPTKDTASLQYTLTLANSPTLPSRVSSQFVVPFAGMIKVPASGTTSTFAVSATL